VSLPAVPRTSNVSVREPVPPLKITPPGMLNGPSGPESIVRMSALLLAPRMVSESSEACGWLKRTWLLAWLVSCTLAPVRRSSSLLPE